MKMARERVRLSSGAGVIAATGAIVAAIVAVCCAARAEDVQLRSRAVALMNHAHAVSQIQGGPWNIRTEATFTATASDGGLQSGIYTRVRGSDGSLREDLTFGEYSASNIALGTQGGHTRNWEDQPLAGVRIRGLGALCAGVLRRE
jgi:hypothetical protein